MAELTNTDLTAADGLQVSQDGAFTVHGSGTFDDLMEAVNKHLDAQFRLSRIQGADYANAYASSLQAAMSNAVQYLLGMANAELIDAQIRKIDAEIVLIGQQGEKTYSERALLDAKKATEYKQGEKIDAERALLDAKRATEDKQLDVLAEQALMIAEQAKGFLWSANQKYMKTIIDGQSVNANIEGVGITGSIYSEANLEDAASVGKPSQP